jgi:N-dimethylarginine dimethylaminohydrolase
MCRPEHFGVIYSINPWMNPTGWARDQQALAAASQQEWARLHRTLLDLNAVVELVPPAAGLPDLVFTANSAVVLDRTVLLARFRYPERQAEEAHFEAVFRRLQGHGVVETVVRLPEGLTLEGAGDCVFDQTRGLFWMGYGPRSDQRARPMVADTFVSPQDRITIAEEDAVGLAANTVCVGTDLVMPSCGARLRARLEERGYRIHVVPLPSFLRSGGAAFCLTLRLDRRSGEPSAAQDAAVA